MTEWIISANAKMYDHSSSFEHFEFIDWRQGNTKYEVNDIVYIYATRPISSIRYKCLVEKINLKHSEIRDDKEYWKNLDEYEKSLQGNFIRLRLIEQVSNRKLNLENLKENGLSAAPQGPVKIRKELSEYLKIHFTDNNQTDYFPDTIGDKIIYEGIKKVITVNKYERSSIARDKCIEFNGLNCFVCGMNFFDVYGEIGEGFIHVHHLTPIHQIGKEYKVNYKEDLAPVCPNCHAMLHRKINGNEPTINELKEIMNKKYIA
ncbi:5-methylcytosine-specific restriction protein A [Runella defluvii]|uniref:5-methylcytosine-specific restriction protein A n=1 Tax=Runella defluvii TaxID=370973 RepID=A0A7W6EPV0_9BACT|nr:HNH endonuclease [Runella defluvii]MBB3837722.1 5-methylcytosine-specific restriction protein A [Runella defluvii]